MPPETNAVVLVVVIVVSFWFFEDIAFRICQTSDDVPLPCWRHLMRWWGSLCSNVYSDTVSMAGCSCSCRPLYKVYWEIIFNTSTNICQGSFMQCKAEGLKGVSVAEWEITAWTRDLSKVERWEMKYKGKRIVKNKREREGLVREKGYWENGEGLYWKGSCKNGVSMDTYKDTINPLFFFCMQM